MRLDSLSHTVTLLVSTLQNPTNHMRLGEGLEQLFAHFCTCQGGAGVNTCCPHTEGVVMQVFTRFFFKTTKKKDGLISDIRRPDDHVPTSGGPLPSDRGEEVFRPVHHPGRRSEDRRRNLYKMPGVQGLGASGAGQEQTSREREAAEARREREARRDRDAENARREREGAEAWRQEQARREQEAEEARREQEAAEARRAQEQEEENQREQERREEEDQAASASGAQTEEEEPQAGDDGAEEAGGDEETDQDAEDSDIPLPEVQQAMRQEMSQSCYAASSCTLAARTGLHLALQPDQRPAVQNLHRELRVVLGALVDRSLPRPRADLVIEALNDVTGIEMFDPLVQECAGEFLVTLVGRLYQFWIHLMCRARGRVSPKKTLIKLVKLPSFKNMYL